MANTKATAAKAAPTVNKEKSVSELIAALAEQTGVSKVQVKALLDAQTELIINELKTAGSVQLSGLGKLKLGARPERQGRNPSTGEAITIKASKTVKLAAGKRLKESL